MAYLYSYYHYYYQGRMIKDSEDLMGLLFFTAVSVVGYAFASEGLHMCMHPVACSFP